MFSGEDAQLELALLDFGNCFFFYYSEIKEIIPNKTMFNCTVLAHGILVSLFLDSTAKLIDVRWLVSRHLKREDEKLTMQL